MDMNTLKRPLMLSGVTIIGTGALLGIGIVLFGAINEFVFKLFLSTIALGYYAVAAACTYGEGRAYALTGTAGTIAGLVGLALVFPIIWGDRWLESDLLVRYASAAGVVAFALAHATTNYRLSSKSSSSLVIMVMANCSVTILTLMFLEMILEKNFHMSEGYLRALIAFGIANVALTIMNPLVGRLQKA
jgi:hypothetical protein